MNPDIVLTLAKTPPDIVSYSSNSLSGDNNDTLKGNLWNRIFKSRLKFNRYKIKNSNHSNFTVKRFEDNETDDLGDNLNVYETNAVERMSLQCSEETSIIADEILHYLTAARKTVHSSGENHSSPSYVSPDTHTVDSEDECGIEF